MPLPPVPVFPSLSYLHSFLLPHLIDEFSASRPVNILSSPPAAECPPLQTKSYHVHWQTLLAWELDHTTLDKERIVLWKVGIKIGTWVNAEFVLAVPGIRENHPRLEIGDLVQLREVYEKLRRGSGMAFEGRVTALRKREGLVRGCFPFTTGPNNKSKWLLDIYSPSLKHYILHVLPPNPQTTDGIYTPNNMLPLFFNISFIANAYPSFIMETASAAMGAALANATADNLARRWLFPEPDELASFSPVCTVDRSFRKQDWFDQGLNSEQRVRCLSYNATCTRRDCTVSWQYLQFHCTSHLCPTSSAAHLGRARPGIQIDIQLCFGFDCISLELLLKLFCRFFVSNQRRAFFFVHRLIQLLIRLPSAFGSFYNLMRCSVSMTRTGPLLKSPSI